MSRRERRRQKTAWPRSYLTKQGQATRAQKEAWERLWSVFGLEYRYGEPIDLKGVFWRELPIVLEIGFGHGEVLIDAAARSPARNFVGIEAHRPSIGATLLELEQANLENVRLLRGDALIALDEYFVGRPFDEVRIYFPEPWPADKDRARRLLRPYLLDLLSKRLNPGGILRVATDMDVYAIHVLELMEHRAEWKNEAGWAVLSPRPERAMSAYEARAIREGRSVYDFSFRYRPMW